MAGLLKGQAPSSGPQTPRMCPRSCAASARGRTGSSPFAGGAGYFAPNCATLLRLPALIFEFTVDSRPTSNRGWLASPADLAVVHGTSAGKQMACRRTCGRAPRGARCDVGWWRAVAQCPPGKAQGVGGDEASRGVHFFCARCRRGGGVVCRMPDSTVCGFVPRGLSLPHPASSRRPCPAPRRSSPRECLTRRS